MRGLITPLITTHEPPSRVISAQQIRPQAAEAMEAENLDLALSKLTEAPAASVSRA